MIQLINKLKKNQKGFTLVELIVVLVILAILAAFTIPAMLGFVDDAKGKALIAQTREVYVASQSAVTEYGSNAADPSAAIDGVYTAADASARATASDGAGTRSDDVINMIYNTVHSDMGTAGTYQYRVTITGGKLVTVEFSDGKKLVTLTPGADAVITDGNVVPPSDS